MAEQISPVLLYILMAGMLVTGTLNTVFLKFMNLAYYTDREGKSDKQFNHAFFQTFIMFIGEFLCLGVYGIMYLRDKKKYGDASLNPQAIEAKKRGLKTNINVCILAIPACFDITASTLMFMGLTMIAASIYQMMRGLIVFVAAIFSIIFLGRRYHRHHWTALAFVVGGVAIVGASPVIFPNSDDDDDDDAGKMAIVGIILVVVAQLFAGGLMISEEKLLGSYYLHPLKVVGWEGFWGCTIYLILLLIFQFITCGDKTICPHGRLEDTPQAFYEMGSNPGILLYGIGSILSIAFFNALGVSVTKFASAAQRSTIDTSRTLLIWGVFLLKPGEGREKFIWLELVGFVLLVLGTLVFNEILVIPILGFNKNTKDAIEARKALEDDREDIEDSYNGNMPTKKGKVAAEKEKLLDTDSEN
ncbi:unnamed protein product [Moneuplotes crassus]|uniref:EamA domain-containing protein n=2 Tax=Euplotes crassus TaxID=5936 RepID=A0AAD1UN08_EUPCR|nr:unnamed protein product [Moneuplotes crassus]